jgi:DNA-binding beta-propeller fold protein YncE
MKQLFTILLVLTFSFNFNAQSISFNSNELYPEGVAYCKKQDVFFVSSLHYGKIGKIDRKGNYTEFVNDSDLVSTIGIRSDEKRNLLYVCVSDPGVSVKAKADAKLKLAKLVAYDLTTGKRKFAADLGALNTTDGNFANDVALDEEGNLYVTNSLSGMIFKITPDGIGSIFTTSEIWKIKGFNLNGIVYHKDGYLIVAQANTGNLFKVSIKDPSLITKINVEPITGCDGLILNDKKELIVISNSKKLVHQLFTTDNFESATIKKTVASEMSFPSTGTIAKGKYFVLNAKLNELFDPKAIKTSNFLLQEIKF